MAANPEKPEYDCLLQSMTNEEAWLTGRDLYEYLLSKGSSDKEDVGNEEDQMELSSDDDEVKRKDGRQGRDERGPRKERDPVKSVFWHYVQHYPSKDVSF